MAQEGARTAATPPVRGGPLDLLRFAAAMLIVVYHYAVAAPVDVTVLVPALSRGYLATDFFLILSGYVLAKSYGARLTAGRTTAAQFLWRRLRRIWPGHVIVLAGFVAVFLAGTALGHPPTRPEDYRPRDLAAQVFLMQAWGVKVGTGWNFPSWSLSALLVCYALFPTAWRAASRLPAASALAAGLLTVLTVDLWVGLVLGRPVFDLPFYLGLLRAPPLFLVGLGLARMTEDHPVPHAWTGWAANLALAGFIALQAVGRFDLVSLALISLVVLACGSMAAPRTSKAVAYLAQLSFSLFLTHVLTAAIWFNSLAPLFRHASTPIRWLVWALSLPVALGGAALFHHLIDQPLQNAIAFAVRRGRERRAQAREAAQSVA